MNISTQLINFLIWSLQKKELTIFLVIDFENFVGDDCISIVSGSTNIQLTNIYCGPGCHGIR
jgi:hypothetical protein